MNVIDQQAFSSHKENTRAEGWEASHSRAPCNGANSDTACAQIQPQSLSQETRHCPQQPLISNRSVTSDISQGPVTIGKNPPWPHVPLLPPAWLLQLQNNLKPGRIRVRNSVFVITSIGGWSTFHLCTNMPRDLPDLKRHLGAESGFRNTFPNVQFRISLLIRFYACLKFQRKGIDYVAVSELGTWTDCTWVIMKEGNPFQTKNSCSQIRS